MTDKKHSLGAGNVTITLGAPDETEDYTLRPTPLVIKTLCVNHGGLRPCIEKIQALDMNMVLQTILLGADAKGKVAREIEDRFWQTSMVGLIQPLTTFLLVMMLQ